MTDTAFYSTIPSRVSAIASWKQFSFELVISPPRVLHRNPQLPYLVHNHKSSEMVMITGGRGVHFTENGIFPLERGHIFVINGGDTHSCQDLNSLCLINLLFGLAKMAISLLGLSQSTEFHTLFIADPAFRRGKQSIGMLKVYDENYRRLIGLVDSLEGSLEADYPGSRFASLSSFLAILSFLPEFTMNNHSPKNIHIPIVLGRHSAASTVMWIESL